MIGSIVLTAILRRRVMGYALFPPEWTTIPPKTVEIGTQTEPDEENPPPPFAEPAAPSSEETVSALEVSPEEEEGFKPIMVKDFVIATILFVSSVAALVFLAFATQAMIWCTKNEHPEASEGYWTGEVAVWWCLYAFVAIYASYGVTVWAMVVRDFFCGEKAKKRWPFGQDAIMILVLWAVMFPFMVVLVVGTMFWVCFCCCLGRDVRKMGKNGESPWEVWRGGGCGIG
jgi:hypothetical protein